MTLALLALLATVAFPNFARIIEANRVVSATNEFKTALNYARSEAVRRNQSVTLAPLSGVWGAGWEANTLDGQTLRRWPQSVDGLSVDNVPSTIRFNSLGRFNLAAAQISIQLGSQGRCIRLESSGLSRALSPPQSCPSS